MPDERWSYARAGTMTRPRRSGWGFARWYYLRQYDEVCRDGDTSPCCDAYRDWLASDPAKPATYHCSLLAEQQADGGWNCEAERGSTRGSFHTTICVLEVLAVPLLPNLMV